MTLYMILPFLLVSIVPNIRMVSLGRRNKRIIWRWVVTYVILCGLRDYAGIDNASYRRYYEMGYGGSVFSLFGEKEPLFIIFREVGYLINENYKWLIVCYAVFTAVVVALALKKYFENESGLAIYIVAMLFFTYPGMFTVMRQAAAMALMLLMYSKDNLSWKKA